MPLALPVLRFFLRLALALAFNRLSRSTLLPVLVGFCCPACLVALGLLILCLLLLLRLLLLCLFLQLAMGLRFLDHEAVARRRLLRRRLAHPDKVVLKRCHRYRCLLAVHLLLAEEGVKDGRKCLCQLRLSVLIELLEEEGHL